MTANAEPAYAVVGREQYGEDLWSERIQDLHYTSAVASPAGLLFSFITPFHVKCFALSLPQKVFLGIHFYRRCSGVARRGEKDDEDEFRKQ